MKLIVLLALVIGVAVTVYYYIRIRPSQDPPHAATDPKEAFLFTIAESGTVRLWKEDFEKLSETEKVFFAVWTLEADVNNGGFGQYYSNSWSDAAYYALTALEKIGAPKMAGIVRRANTLFPNGDVPKDRDERNRIIERLSDDEGIKWEELSGDFLEYPENLSALLYEFCVTRKSEFRGL